MAVEQPKEPSFRLCKQLAKNRRNNMKRISAALCIFIVLLTQQVTIAESILDNKPGWLNGILSIDLYGADSLEDSWPYDRYVCLFDFKLGRVDMVKIPDSSTYTKEWKGNGSPIIIYPSEHGYYYMDNYSSWKWREYNFIKIIQMVSGNTVRYTYGEPWRDIWTGEETKRTDDDDSAYYETYSSKSPMRVLGIQSEYISGKNRDLVSAIFLKYGLSDNGDTEIQLVRGDDIDFPNVNEQILNCFPLDYDFGSWQYSISETGSVAWIEKMSTLVCSDANGVKNFNSVGWILGCPIWYDENTILFFETNDNSCIFPTETVLKKWNVSNDTVEDFLDGNGKRIEGGICPFTMALNDGKRILAVYGWIDESNIKIFNLDNGDTYILNPWPNYREKYDSRMLKYGYAEDGTLYFDPANCFQSQLVWFPE